MFKIDLAIKFGSNEISIYQKSFGIVSKQPAYLAVDETGRTIKVRYSHIKFIVSRCFI